MKIILLLLSIVNLISILIPMWMKEDDVIWKNVMMWLLIIGITLLAICCSIQNV